MQYICSICGYLYDEAQGDPANDIAPGTCWDALPASWVCPPCRAAKSAFHPYLPSNDIDLHLFK